MTDKPKPSAEDLIDRIVEDTVVDALFGGNRLARRRFVEQVGSGTLLAALSSVFPLSTVLNLIAGLDRPSEGYVFVNQRAVEGPGLSRGVVFQNHSLLPWLSALGNVMFSVRARHPRWPDAKIREHSERFLKLVGLNGVESRKPSQLSGGMRQRVGIARAFAIEPEMLLLDEPFGALDALTRTSIQDQLLELWQQVGQTVVMITHDVDEAIYLSDRVLVMSDGPGSRIAEFVAIDLPRPRARSELLRSARYHELRAHLLDFLSHGARAGREPLPAASAEASTLVLRGLGTID